MTTSLTWNGDPTILVYAARWALACGQGGSHAPRLVADTIWANHDKLTHGARQILVKEITAWLDGRGMTAAAEERRPWVDALDMIGGPRRAITLPPAAPPIPAQRRATDQRAAVAS